MARFTANKNFFMGSLRYMSICINDMMLPISWFDKLPASHILLIDLTDFQNLKTHIKLNIDIWLFHEMGPAII